MSTWRKKQSSCCRCYTFNHAHIWECWWLVLEVRAILSWSWTSLGRGSTAYMHRWTESRLWWWKELQYCVPRRFVIFFFFFFHRKPMGLHYWNIIVMRHLAFHKVIWVEVEANNDHRFVIGAYKNYFQVGEILTNSDTQSSYSPKFGCK